jgi:hypothetical protein
VNMRLPHPRILFFLFICLFSLMAQMPDWKYFRDREGNAYFIDQAGKIRITDVKEYRYRPVSSRGIDYYLNYGTTLIQDHRLDEGLSVLKSICALPVDNNRTYQAQVKAMELINTLKRKNGPRFAALNESASLMLFKKDDVTHIINDQMHYSFKAPCTIGVVRKRDRGRAGVDYQYSGVQFGLQKSDVKGAKAGEFDMLMAVDSEKFSVAIKNIDDAADKWKWNTGYDGLTREVVAKDDGRLIYQFRSSGPAIFAGLEGIFLNGNYTHCVRIVSSEPGYRANREFMRNLLESFKPVSKSR